MCTPGVGDAAASTSPLPALGTSSTAAPTAFKLSVILPVYNAMPWLPVTMLHLLSQRLDADAPLELLVGFDGGDDGSLDFLLRLVAELGAPRATEEVCTAGAAAAACNPALALPLRAAETADHPSFAASEAPEAQQPLSVQQVAAACRPEHRLRVLRHGDGVNRGQVSLPQGTTHSAPHSTGHPLSTSRSTPQSAITQLTLTGPRHVSGALARARRAGRSDGVGRRACVARGLPNPNPNPNPNPDPEATPNQVRRPRP